jgi:Ca2+-transporting ATPase
MHRGLSNGAPRLQLERETVPDSQQTHHSSPQVETAWARPVDQVASELGVAPKEGLSSKEAKARLKRYGPNALRKAERESAWAVFFRQFKSLIVALLAVAAVVSLAFGENIEAAAIAAVILINTLLGFFTELRAVRSMEALRELGRVETKVRRDGQVQEIPAEELVPGDVVALEAGDIIAADLRLTEASKLQADESALTGESLPVGKDESPVAEEAPLAEHASMLYKGTAVTRGSAEGVVVATGMATELGEISTLVAQATKEITPLEKRLDQLGHRLIFITLGITAVVAASGIIVQKPVLLMIQTAIALAVAAIPEGLPIVATIALARGMWRMARRNAVVNRLSAVETLGSTSVICSDKTGTLTENQMTLTRLLFADNEVQITGEGLETEGEFQRDEQALSPDNEPLLRAALEVCVLCNNAALPTHPDSERKAVGDPMEVALLVAGAKADIARDELVDAQPEVREEAFDTDTKMMATFHQADDGLRVAVKGAPEAVLGASIRVRANSGERDLTDEARQEWLDRSTALAEQGRRMLALATKTAQSEDEAPYEDLTLLALVGLQDPPREDVRDAIGSCRGAGIRVVMVTGDQAPTASSIARAVGLVDEGHDTEVIQGSELEHVAETTEADRQRFREAAVFARVEPKQKLNLIDIHQKAGAVVAMTGDGVNDAPALKEADIGVAMGQRGTQVAREAADMVLKDDAFSTIVAAVEQGRVIFSNIRKFCLYLLSCNFSEILAVFLASLINAPLPILPLQILFVNLVTDVFPALALGVGEGDPRVMERPPRDPREAIVTRENWFAIAGYGLLITAAVLGALALAIYGLGLPDEEAITISFLTLALAQLWHVFNMREPGSRLLRNDITRNVFVWGALALCLVLVLAAAYVPGLSDVLQVQAPGLKGWGLVLGMSLLPLLVGQAIKAIRS